MSFWTDLFGGGDQPYPTTRSGPVSPPCGAEPFLPPEPDGFMNKLFAPAQLAYPVSPTCGTRINGGGTLGSGGPGNGGGASSGGSPSTTPPTVGPILAVIAKPAPTSAASSGDASTTTAATASSTDGSAASTANGNASSTPNGNASFSPSTPLPTGDKTQPATPAAPTASPVTVVFAAPWAAPPAAPCPATPSCPTTPSASDSGPTSSATTTPPSTSASAPPPTVTGDKAMVPAMLVQPPPPSSVVQTADVLNPRFRAQHRRAHEELLEQLLDEKVGAHMVTRESPPVAFVVPDGYNAAELTFGAIELNQGHGKPGDLDQAVTLGTPTVTVDGQAADPSALTSLSSGSTVAVTLPWRVGSWVEMGASHLKVTVYLRFYQFPLVMQPLSQS